MDCLFCCDDSENIIRDMLVECHRVMKPEAVYILLSLHDSSKILPHVTGPEFHWRITHHPVPNPRFDSKDEEKGVEMHHFFILKKY